MHVRPTLVLLLAAAMVASLAPVAGAVPADGEVEFAGGGYGHGIGLSQYGAQGMALDGKTAGEIATHYFFGTSIGQVADMLPADNFLLAYDQPLWVGLLQSRLTFQFRAIGGDLELCQANDGEGACPKSVTPRDGELWSFTFNGSQCQFEFGGVPQGNPGDCSASISWTEGTRVELPDLGLSFAHGTLKIRPVGTLPTLKFHVSLAVDVEDYIAGIAEMPPSWEASALQAQAIAARSYAIAKAQQRETGDRVGTLADAGLSSYWKDKCWCHVRRTSVDQVYNGWDQEQQSSWVAAATATAGKVLTHPDSGFTQNGVIEAFYTSSSSGVTETNIGGFGSLVQYPYLVSVDDSWASDPALNPLAVWSKTVAASTIVSALATTTREWHADFDTLTGASLINGPPEAFVRFSGTTGGIASSVDAPGWWLRSVFGLLSPQVTGVTMGGDAPPPPGEVQRLWGEDRYATAAALSEATYPDGASVVYIATGENFADALTAAPAAHQEGAPILLTLTDLLPSATKLELTRLNPGRIVILGGPAAVSASVETELAAFAPQVVRREGPTRFETAVEVSRAVFAAGVPVVYVVPGFDFPEALAAGPAAAAQGGPVLPMHPAVIPTAVKDELARLEPARIVIVGDEGAVSGEIEAELAAYTTGAVERIAGADLYETAALVSAQVFGSGVATAYVARGDLFPDGLAAAPAAAAMGAPVLLVASDAIPDSVDAELVRLLPHDIVVAGGEGAVSAEVEQALQAFLQ
ncbi:MAG: SpoIID/LytB domain-containing protein [Gammaproteobacteria bacterium]|nr:SpoIID/LytB domain-containing protein [Gammaproteobacteria bacterium]